LKYKFGGPGTLEKILGSTVSWRGPLNLLVLLTAVWGLSKLARSFLGPRIGIPPYFHNWIKDTFMKCRDQNVVNSSQWQNSVRSTCHTRFLCDELTDCRSARDNAVKSYSQLVTRVSGMMSWLWRVDWFPSASISGTQVWTFHQI